jgi:threonine/homoserine/homoserine lactone efflux protein
MSLHALQVGLPGAVELVVVLLILLLSFVVPLVVSFLVYRDAKGRGSRHALAWGLGAFFGSLVVWILYWVVRDEVGPGGTPA